MNAWHARRYGSATAGHLDARRKRGLWSASYLTTVPADPTEHRLGRRASTGGLTTASSATTSFATKHRWRRLGTAASVRGVAEPLAAEHRF
ncbi:hypothetical protein B8W69_17060 [Mycobacterium vulneris]|uniref:Uncharacterized protein n=1 Tax=Mycolicibacterium vulneris TaxID=547163 RepID=A0A1X2KWF1_9MYCO|nr:hypothetical protein [Mycolicibacterium vulneris]OSC26136.1 hypothetical protein B8W69_17060 [Mycolicibacterium vulneris]